MDLWDHSDPHLLQQPRRSRRDNPSFSSSLLDAIYRSIDESNSQPEDHLIFYTHNTTKHTILPATVSQDHESLKFRMIDTWIDKKKKLRNIRDFTLSSSSSSESSSTAGRRFSSSETEFLSRALHRPTKLKPKPKPIKTNTWPQTEIITPNPKHDNGFVKSKSKASKIYHDLKKVKQPISPGARLASFLNSLFNGGSPKAKQKISSSTCSINSTKFDYDMSRKSKSQQGSTSTCSSASSFSRSCLSKTPSSRGNIKRSVRFCPVSVIVDEDCQPCGHKILHKSEEPIMKKVIGIERYREELPVYETTHFKTNCAIAKGLVL
ncbi:protein BIG GRAIN 1-like B [Cucumis melo var. makuwa]|uniref:Protein BIG GRAIN 1-like B n=1 Tax=Cucumis melo var. makuwa TaxID=1194695 RepID=A0A5A7UUT6_CUCMM|nr:protein BIG GRAIN 1-like B [Cucumis melo var. makuwa]TYK07248.1 protein BIG GRAIN 1-like B [Cucumis melo var. makuwa]